MASGGFGAGAAMAATPPPTWATAVAWQDDRNFRHCAAIVAAIFAQGDQNASRRETCASTTRVTTASQSCPSQS